MANLVFAGTGHIFPEHIRNLNMLQPSRPGQGEAWIGGGGYVVAWTKADYFKDWIPFNLLMNAGADINTAAFGAFTTAPDGTTNTARKLVDTVANSEHSFITGVQVFSSGRFGKLRLTGIFKYAGRRIVLSIQVPPSAGGGAGTFGCKAVFDLQNGQIAVDTAMWSIPPVTSIPIGANAWTVSPAQIRAVGNEWYVCSVEALCTGGYPHGLYGKVWLDNAIGMAAESSTYAGDGTSGVYGWRSNLLPSRAWNLTEEVFRDDFDDDTRANMDLTDSRVEGYDWYMCNMFPAYDGNGNQPCDPDSVLVSDSVLHLTNHPLPLSISSFASLWRPPSEYIYTEANPEPPPGRNYTAAYVGKGWVPPFLIESKVRFDNSAQNRDGVTIWTSGLEWLTGGRHLDPTMVSREVDYFETKLNGAPGTHCIYYGPTYYMTGTGEKGGSNSFIGLDQWSSRGLEYQPPHAVHYLSTRYTSLAYAFSNSSNNPVARPDLWGTYVRTPARTDADVPNIMFSDWHTYSTLWFPRTSTEPGQIMVFWDGLLCGIPLIYADASDPWAVHDNTFTASDWQQMPIFFGNNTWDCDWVRVMK